MLPAVVTTGNATPSPPLLRTGIPLPTSRLISAAKKGGYSILCSANSFADRFPQGHQYHLQFRKFRLPRTDSFRGVDVALDSAGFVASRRYGDYPWTVDQYLDLVASHPWAWWAAMDYCCEPEIAGNKALRILRIAATVARYFECLRGARKRGLPDPLPVLQGWTTQEYRLCIEWLALNPWPALVGVGSVCRRHVRGGNGILEIVDALDAVLPPHVRLHLFGVKSDALIALAHHPRVASTDSMAWDAAARRERPVGRSMDFRIQTMEKWTATQNEKMTIKARGGGFQTTLQMLFNEEPRTDFEAVVLESLALQHARLVASNEISYLDAVWYLTADAVTALGLISHGYVTPENLSDLDELIAGLADHISRLWLSSDRTSL